MFHLVSVTSMTAVRRRVKVAGAAAWSPQTPAQARNEIAVGCDCFGLAARQRALMAGSGRKHHCRCFANSTPLIGSKRTTNRRANDAKTPATFMFSPAGNVYVPAKTHPSSSRVHCRLLSPGRDKPPAHFRQQRFVIGNMDHIDLLRRGDVVAWLKVQGRPGQVINVPDFLPRIAFGETTAHRGRQFDTVCSGRQDLPRGPVIYRAFTTGENLATH